MINPKNIKIQKATLKDLNDISLLEMECFKEDAFSKRQFRYLIKKANGEFVVVRTKQKLIAYLIFLKRKNSHKYRIYSIAIDPKVRGLGIATKLLMYAEKKALKSNIHQIALEVSENNESAIALYQKLGYTKIGFRPSYYSDGSSAIIMTKDL
jgi:ribosomal-protein-alanine acetyltransferase